MTSCNLVRRNALDDEVDDHVGVGVDEGDALLRNGAWQVAAQLVLLIKQSIVSKPLVKCKRCDSEEFISNNDEMERFAMGLFIYSAERRGKRARLWRDRECVGVRGRVLRWKKSSIGTKSNC